MTKKYKKWTEEEDNLLIQYTNDGFTHKEIAILLNRTVSMIHYRCRILKTISKNEGTKKCNKCNTKIISSELICNNCGYKFKECQSLAEKYPNLLEEWDYDRNIIKPNNITCKSNKGVWWICNKNHTWFTVIHKRTLRNEGCPYCSGHKVLKGFNDLWTTHPELCEELVNKEDGYKITKGSEKIIEWKCKNCSYIWKSNPCARTYKDAKCPKCNSSKGENKISNFLDKIRIKYEIEKIFKQCKNKKYLRFDFYLPDYNICIEYQGEWHYKPHWSSNGQYSLISTKKRDRIKEKFCKQNDIYLITIPYWQFDNIEIILKMELYKYV